MKLYDLEIGQIFNFQSKRPGRTFEIISTSRNSVVYKEIPTGEEKTAYSGRKTFRESVELINQNVTLTLGKEESQMLEDLLIQAYKLSAENGCDESDRSKINILYQKLIGSRYG